MIRRITVGPIGENAYIVEQTGRPVVVVDPGAEPARLLEAALDALGRSRGEDASTPSVATPSVATPSVATPSVAIILTHGHLDHVAALPALAAGLRKAGVSVRVYAPEGDRDYFGPKARETNLRVFTDIGAQAFFRKHWTDIPEADVYYGDGYDFPGLDIKAIHSPGHTRGSSCLLAEGGSSLLSGDTLFRDGVGRTDNFDADEATIVNSIRERLCVLHDAVRVWPGHGDQTTIGREKRYFLR